MRAVDAEIVSMDAITKEEGGVVVGITLIKVGVAKVFASGR